MLIGLRNYNRIDVVLPLAFRISAGFVGLLLNYVLIKTIGITETGKFAAYLSLVTLLSLACNLGLDSFVLRELGGSSAKGNRRDYTATYITTMSIVIILSLFVMFFTAQLFVGGDSVWSIEMYSSMSPIALLAILSIALISINSEGLKSQQQVSWAIIFRMLLTPATTMIVLLVLHRTKYFDHVDSLLVFTLCSWFVLLVSTGTFYRYSEFRKPNYSHISLVATKIKRESLFLFVFSISSASLQHLGILLFSAFGSADRIALLSVSIKISMLIGVILSGINAVLIPKAIRSNAIGDLVAVEKVVENYTNLCTLISVPLATIVCLFSPQILGVFSTEFKGEWYVLCILVLGQVFNACAGPVAQLSILFKDTRFLAITFFLVAMISALLLRLSNGDILLTTLTIASSIGLINMLLVWRIKSKFGIHTSPIVKKIGHLIF